MVVMVMWGLDTGKDGDGDDDGDDEKTDAADEEHEADCKLSIDL